MMTNELLSAEAKMILAMPLPQRTAALLAAPQQVKDEITIECQRRLNEKFPDHKKLTNALTDFLLK
jgi:hypothetical protein